jgi:hypothetical protein
MALMKQSPFLPNMFVWMALSGYEIDPSRKFVLPTPENSNP